MKVLNYVNRTSQYYPTPEYLVKPILEQIKDNFKDLVEINFLEPCAGDGAICRTALDFFKQKKIDIKINCIEKEPVLNNALKGQGYNVLDFNFETFEGSPFYDLIIMNPPFSKGAKFLLKAYELLNANGTLVCILNAETIKNTHTKEREQLKNLISMRGEVEFMSKSFEQADRQTDVEIAVVYLKKQTYENEFDILGNIKTNVLTREEIIQNHLKEKIQGDNSLMSFNKIENAITIYRNVVEQTFKGIEAINQIKTSLSYLTKEAEEFNIKPEKFIEIILKNNNEQAKNLTIKEIRKMVWSYVLKFCDMEQYLYTKQKQDFNTKLEKGASVLPFTKNNISQFFDNIFITRQELFEKGVQDLFEQITSYYNGNPHHREGWKTNKNWKINKKIIIDSWGVEFDNKYNSDGSGDYRLRYGSLDWLNDLEKIVRKIKYLNYTHDELTIKETLRKKFNELGRIQLGQKYDNTCETPYFKVKFFKKGTLHIEFKDKKILDELNILGAHLRRDLGYNSS